MTTVRVNVASASDFAWVQTMVATHHYLRKPADRRSRPLAYVLRLAGERVGCLVYGRTQSTSCYQGGLTYGSGAAVRAGRAAYDRWEVLNLARVWLDARVQAGGAWCRPGLLPGFTDRRGYFRSTLASWVIRQTLGVVGFDYLQLHPPCFVDEPYQVRCVLSYCDSRLHRGTIYRAAGFELARRNEDGVETWWTADVAPLTAEQDVLVRRLSRLDERAARIRGRRVTHPGLFEES